MDLIALLGNLFWKLVNKVLVEIPNRYYAITRSTHFLQ